MVFAVLVLVLAIGIISSWGLKAPRRIARHLFLKSQLIVAGQIKFGYIRALDLASALVVTSFSPGKNEVVEVDLSSLPNFPASSTKILARVRHVKRLGGQPSNYLVYLKFDKVSASQVQEPLGSYLKQLLAY